MENYVKVWWITVIKKLLGVILFASILSACGHSSHKKEAANTYVVHKESLHKMLHFTGTVQPLKESPLVGPMEAVVEAMHAHYGESVKKDSEVFTLLSVELQKQFNDTLTDYLKAKDSYTIALSKFRGTTDLWDSGLMSKNNYLSEKSSLNTARVTLMQSTRKLNDMLKKMGDGDLRDFSKLSFSDFDKVRSALSGKHDLIHIKSPTDGVLLYPPKGSEDKSGRITVGSPTKPGQVLALVGDLSGIRLEIDVPEIDMDKIKIGMPATINGVAFAKHQLKGALVSINAQASTASGGALPSFTAIVEVKGLNHSQQAWIKVGMSATIDLAIESADKLLVPISTVHQQDGKSVVHVREASGKRRVQIVVTGAAQGDQVVIDAGLKEGDVIAYE